MSHSAGRILAGLLFLALSGPLAADLNGIAELIEAGKHQRALDDLARQPGSYHSRLLRANALVGLNRNDEAERLYRALIDEQPQNPTPYNNLATLYAAAGRLQEASELLTRAMKSDARYAAIYKNLSRVYVEMSRNSYARALRLSEQKQGLKLLSLDYRDVPPQVAQQEPLQLAAVTPAPQTAPAVLGTAPVAAPIQAPVSQPIPPVQPQPAAQEFDAGGAIAALKLWADAWSAQNVAGYLAAYDVDYLPPGGLSLEQWQAQRRLRLKKPKKIEVFLSDFEVSSSGGGTLTVKLVQRYRSDHYRDSTRKGFILVPRNGEWKIGDEYTIGVIN